MIKRIFLYIAVMMSLAACSDDIMDWRSEELSADGKLTVSFSVPQMKRVATRAEINDQAVNKITMLVFDGPNGNLKQVEEWNCVCTDGKVPAETVTIKEGLRKNGNLAFYFVANSPITKNGFEENQSLAQIKQILNSDLISGSSMVMSGKATLQDLLGMNTVSLIRHAAKVTVKSEDGKTSYLFRVFGTASQSSILAGAENITDYPTEITFPNALAESEKEDVVYMHPTVNTGARYLTDSYIIVKAKYGDKDYYYRLDFQNEKGVLDILPNHYYEVKIIGAPKAAGYATPEEASKNPTPLSSNWYIIDDHAPVVFNMISDGSHELGVSHIVFNNNPAFGSTADLYVKVYSVDKSSEETDFKTDYEKLITFDKDWIRLDGIEEVTSGDNVIDAGAQKNGGRVYRITLKFLKSSDLTEATATGKVVWMGLSREFKVEWNRVFDPSALLKSVKLTVTDNSGAVQWGIYQDDYFPFLRGNDGTGGQVWGVSAEDNNGVARDEGLHFPLHYGETGSLWKYEYQIEFNDLGDGEKYDWSARMSGDAAVKSVTISTTSGTLTGSGPKMKLTRACTGDDWDYGTGTLDIIVKKNGESVTYSVPVYHTGFFHKDVVSGNITASEGSNSKTVSIIEGTTDTSRPYTYYEVVSMGDRHWLDRNLGAHSAGLYIENSDGSAYVGENSSAGYYYRVGAYKKYGSPEMKTDICPPGYTYPTQMDLDEVRNSGNFSTAVVGNYNTASYRVSSEKTVYFPKARYYDSSNVKMGEARAGYYWTSTPATGTEKEEVGAWLKCLNFTGSATSYVNGEVVCPSVGKTSGGTRNATNGFAMLVRCVNTQTRTNTYQKVNFYVKGATHVYLYTVDSNGVKTGVTTWPGKAIGTHNSVTSNYFNFLYETATINPNDLYVIFNYKDSNGQIHSYSAQADKTQFKYTTSEKPSDLVGWKVIGDPTPTAGIISALGGYWTMSLNPLSFSFDEEPAIANGKMRIYFNRPSDWNNTPNCYAFDSSSNNGTPGQAMSVCPTNSSWYYVDIETKYTSILFNNGGWDYGQYPGNGQNFSVSGVSGGKYYFDSSGSTSLRP